MDKKTNKDVDKEIDRVKDRSGDDLRKSNNSKLNHLELELKDRGDSRAITNQKTMKPKDRGDSRLTSNIKLMKTCVEKKKHAEDGKKTNETQKRDTVRKTEDFKPQSTQKTKNFDNKNVTADAQNKIFRDTLKKSLIRIAKENSHSKMTTNQNSKVVEDNKSSVSSRKSLLRIAEESVTQKAKQNVEKNKKYERNSTSKKEVRKAEENANQKSILSFEKKRVEGSKNSESSKKSLIIMMEEITDFSEDVTNQLIKSNVDRKDVTEDNINASNEDISRLIEDITNRKIKMNVEKKKEENKNDKKDSMKKVETTPNRTYLDVEGRKKLRERYTVKLKNNQNINKSDVIVDAKDNEINVAVMKLDEELAMDNLNESRELNCTEPIKVKQPCQRKPIIKTVTVKNDNRVYKAVTFVDQKHHTPLEIKIPNYKKQKVREVKIKSSKVKMEASKESIKAVIKKVKVKRRGKRPRVLSPEFFMKGNASPPTEVAKWAPSCMNHHTKPYYEAWVDTTLAAISKCSKKDKLFMEKQNLIKTFKRALEERPETPELVYEKFADERYTGKIKVRQR